MFVGNKFGTGLVDTNAVNLVRYSQPIEQRQIQGKQQFTDMKARKTLLLQNDDVPVLLRL